MATKASKKAKAKKRDRRAGRGGALAVPTDDFCLRVSEETSRDLFRVVAANHLNQSGRADGALRFGTARADGVEVVFHSSYHARHDLLTVHLFTLEELEREIAGRRAQTQAPEKAEQN